MVGDWLWRLLLVVGSWVEGARWRMVAGGCSPRAGISGGFRLASSDYYLTYQACSGEPVFLHPICAAAIISASRRRDCSPQPLACEGALSCPALPSLPSSAPPSPGLRAQERERPLSGACLGAAWPLHELGPPAILVVHILQLDVTRVTQETLRRHPHLASLLPLGARFFWAEAELNSC